MPAVSADRFLDALRQSGLLAGEMLEAQVRRSAAEGPPEDARELADRFIRDGLLTGYQAERLLRGQWQSLLIAGKYAVLAPLGVGGMGQVYLTEHIVLRRRSAVKVLPARMMSDPAAIERFQREARAVAALDHPNIVRAYDIDTADELHFLVMEYVDGVSLQELVARSGPAEPAAAANYIAQAACGLQHAHEAGWVHRDIKPANLLLDRGGTVKVLDLGLARLLADDVEPLTATNDALGTADYLAPEQGADSHAADIRADIYSLGATLHFLLSGKPPFPDGTPAQKVLWHQTKRPQPIRELRPDVPAGLAAVLDRMLAKDPADRYATPLDVAVALKPWTGGDENYPPPADLGSGEPVGSRSGVMSSWARHAGLSGSKRTPRPARKAAPVCGETAGAAADTGPVGPLTTSSRRRRRWSVLAGAIAVFGLIATGTAVLWPRTPAPEPIGEVRRFVGHTAAIEKVAFTPNGKRLITASQDRTARVWDVATGAELNELVGHTAAVRGLDVLPDGRRAVTAGWDGTVRLWDLDTARELRQYKGHTGEVWWVTCDAAGKRLLTCGKDQTIRLWDVESGDELKRMGGQLGHVGIVTAALFLPDGRVVSAGVDHFVRVWDLETGKPKGGVRASKPVYRLSLCPVGRWVLFGCNNHLVRWDADASRHDSKIPVTEAVESALCLADGRVALAVLDGTIRLWDVGADREVHKFDGNGLAVLALAAAPDGEHIASGGRDKIARLWHLPPGR